MFLLKEIILNGSIQTSSSCHGKQSATYFTYVIYRFTYNLYKFKTNILLQNALLTTKSLL